MFYASVGEVSLWMGNTHWSNFEVMENHAWGWFQGVKKVNSVGKLSDINVRILCTKSTHIWVTQKCGNTKNYVQVDKPHKHSNKKLDSEDIPNDSIYMMDMNRQNYHRVIEVRITVSLGIGVLTRKGRLLQEVFHIFTRLSYKVCKDIQLNISDLATILYPLQFSN